MNTKPALNIYFPRILLALKLLIFTFGAVAKIEKINYGKSFEGKDLIAYKIYEPNKIGPYSKKAIFLSAGSHGNEVTGHLRSFLTELESSEMQNLIDDGLTVLIIPSLNPDGVSRKRRLSHPGLDLNRQFHEDGYQVQEAYFLKQLVKREITDNKLDVKLAIDYHCCANSLIRPAGIQKTNPIFEKYNDILDLGKELLSSEIKMGQTKDFFAKSNIGTLKDYWHENHEAVSLTFEAPDLRPSSGLLDNHKKWLFAVIRTTLQ